ncbi:retrograde regulation protein 2 [Rhizodiscina lignyota]|uniref:Retrograde regulation protein 2 n=1 Tax=Rhizodiscina lignyota TaxID=1504668 RepID=A0A9P4M426_9PEZI|nr:retrograde regulation protein 2 [Rhizodiscina lignyota]
MEAKNEKNAVKQYVADSESDSYESAETIEFRKKEAKVVRKLDLFIAPVMMALMCISYLDRRRLNAAVSVFYVTYICAEFPTSMVVKRLSFKRVIPIIAFCWGLVCMCMGFIHGFGALVALRLLLGFFEGCLFPSMTLFLANWYKREELGLRIAYLFIASALSGAFGGLLAFGILHMDGTSGMAGWRWLYIIEGLITITFASVVYFLIPKNYSSAYFLNEEERVIMRHRAELMESYSGGQGHYTKGDVWLAVTDVKTWLHSVTQVAIITILYGFGTFLPVIIKYGFGLPTLQAQYLVIPVNLWGAIVYLAGAILADRYKARFLTLIITMPFGIAGYAILLNQPHVSTGVLYFATYLISTACYLCTGTNTAWLTMNCAPDGKRAASLGVQLTCLNVGGIIAGQIYRSDEAPRFVLGHAWSLGSYGVAWIGLWITFMVYKSRDARKEKMRAEGRVEEEAFTDRSPLFKYQY